jgi:hypothetical protein
MSSQDFDRNARSLLRLRISEGSPSGVNYAPDSHYDDTKRCVVCGPLTIQIDRILRRHAKLWAQNMRDMPPADSAAGKAAWLAEMREADAEIKRYLAGHTLGHGAAA